MEFKERKLGIILSVVAILMIVAILIPLIMYYLNFGGNGLSDDDSKWSSFGDYVGGVVGTNLGVIALIISSISVIYSLKVSSRIHQNETELVKTQNKPYGHIELVKYYEITEIIIHNHGIGPLIVDKVVIKNAENKIYNNFNTLLRFELGDIYPEDNVLIKFNSDNKLVIGPNSFKSILKVYPAEQINDGSFENIQDRIRHILMDFEMDVEYSDIFDYKYSIKQYLDFFNPNLLV